MSTPHSLGGSGATLLFLACVCWLLMSMFLLAVAGKEAHGDAAMGQGIAWLLAIVLAGLTWLWLGGLLLKAGTEQMLPAWGGFAALALYLASGGAVAASLFLLQNPKVVWPIVAPLLIPPILAVYVAGLYLPSLRPAALSTGGAALIWGVLTILTLLPWPPLALKLKQDKANAVEQVRAQSEWEKHERERNRSENLVKLQAMKHDQPLMDWYPLLEEKGGVRGEALEALRHVERRQADIEDMLSWGITQAMILLPELNLEARPQLCEAARAFLMKNAKETRVRPKQDPREYASGGYVEQSQPGIRWLMAHGCDMDEAIAAMQKSVETFIDTPDRRAALAALAALRKK